MNSLAAVHLRQARAFLRAGKPQRALELLEKARALARDDPEMLSEILEFLVVAYMETGAPEKAAKCAEQVGRSSHRAQEAHSETAITNRFTGGSRWVAVVVALFAVSAVIIFVMRGKSRAPLVAIPSTAPIARDVAATIVAPTATPHPATTRSAQISRAMTDARVRPCIALLVLLGHYEGLTNGEHLKVDVPLSSAAAFVANRAGNLLTVRHVTHLAKENNFPSTLESWKLPTVTLRDIRYVLCFSADPNDWVDANLVYENDQQDIAVLSTGRHLSFSLDSAGRDAVRGEILYAWTYPGVLTFGGRDTNPAKVEQMIQSLPQTHSANLLTAVNPRFFIAAKIPSEVVVAERHEDGGEFVELGVKPSIDNGGGPIVDARGRVIAITEPAGKLPGNALGLLINQFQDALAPYLMPGSTGSGAAASHPASSGNGSRTVSK